MQVGAQPPCEELVRAIANMKLVGSAGYFDLYRDLAAQLAKALATMQVSHNTAHPWQQ